MNNIKAVAVLRTVQDGRKQVNLWVIEDCPFCHKKHTHGAGRPGVDDPRSYLGHRVAHCDHCPSRQYKLVEADNRG